MNKKDYVRIKYDRQTMNILKWTCVFATALFGIGLLSSFFDEIVVNTDGLAVVILFCLYIGAGLCVVSYGNIIAGFMYMKRLKKYGYVIPEKKKEYDGKLENLPKENDVTQTSVFGKHSKYCFVACLLIFAIFFILDIKYLITWGFMKVNCKAMFIMCLIFYLIWIVFALILKTQSNGEKYRDDVETDTSRKERWSIEQVIFTIVILVLLSLFANYTAHSMTKYFFEGMIDYDMVQADTIRCAVVNAISQHTDESGAVIIDETYNELCEGVDITTWGIPADELQEIIAREMQVDDFSQLNDYFKLADGDAEIFVKIVDDNVTVRLLNPVKQLLQKSDNTFEIYIDYKYNQKYN